MYALFPTRSGHALHVLRLVLGRVLFLFVPAGLLLLASLRTTGHTQIFFAIGTGFQAIVCTLHFLSHRNWHQSVGPSVVSLYLIALGWLWIGVGQSDDWFLHLSQAVLLIVPLVVFAWQILYHSGAPTLRRAQTLAKRLSNRRDWPPDLAGCRNLPEVKAFRVALHIDAAPALSLLQHPRAEVRIAALFALEYYKNWRPGQPELILQLAHRAPEPPIRSAAVLALANLDDRFLVEALAEFLWDPSREVRRAATEALLWTSEQRWAWIRYALRRTLADPAFQDDGALEHNGQLLPPVAVADLIAWAGERGIIGLRSALTLGRHYARCLMGTPDGELIRELQSRLADNQTPPALRMELARLLQGGQRLDPRILEGMLDSSNSASLRLLAVETLLAAGPHSKALATLHDLGRLPNRELALATAEVVQRRCGVDLGLPLGQPLPPVHSRQAAEVARRVMLWANTQHEERKLAAADRCVE